MHPQDKKQLIFAGKAILIFLFVGLIGFFVFRSNWAMPLFVVGSVGPSHNSDEPYISRVHVDCDGENCVSYPATTSFFADIAVDGQCVIYVPQCGLCFRITLSGLMDCGWHIVKQGYCNYGNLILLRTYSRGGIGQNDLCNSQGCV